MALLLGKEIGAPEAEVLLEEEAKAAHRFVEAELVQCGETGDGLR